MVEKRREFEEYKRQIPDRQFEAGEAFPFPGEPQEILVETRSANEVEDGPFRLAEHHDEQPSMKRAVRRCTYARLGNDSRTEPTVTPPRWGWITTR